jgi:hypothetical protein
MTDTYRVRDLEWDEYGDALAARGESIYQIEQDKESGGWRVWWHLFADLNSELGLHESLSAAKAAANEHNRQRIAERYLEVVETPTNKAVRKALQRFSNPERPEPLKGSTVFDDERGAR